MRYVAKESLDVAAIRVVGGDADLAFESDVGFDVGGREDHCLVVVGGDQDGLYYFLFGRLGDRVSREIGCVLGDGLVHLLFSREF